MRALHLGVVWYRSSLIEPDGCDGRYRVVDGEMVVFDWYRYRIRIVVA